MPLSRRKRSFADATACGRFDLGSSVRGMPQSNAGLRSVHRAHHSAASRHCRADAECAVLRAGSRLDFGCSSIDFGSASHWRCAATGNANAANGCFELQPKRFACSSECNWLATARAFARFGRYAAPRHHGPISDSRGLRNPIGIWHLACSNDPRSSTAHFEPVESTEFRSSRRRLDLSASIRCASDWRADIGRHTGRAANQRPNLATPTATAVKPANWETASASQSTAATPVAFNSSIDRNPIRIVSSSGGSTSPLSPQTLRTPSLTAIPQSPTLAASQPPTRTLNQSLSAARVPEIGDLPPASAPSALANRPVSAETVPAAAAAIDPNFAYDPQYRWLKGRARVLRQHTQLASSLYSSRRQHR